MNSLTVPSLLHFPKDIIKLIIQFKKSPKWFVLSKYINEIATEVIDPYDYHSDPIEWAILHKKEAIERLLRIIPISKEILKEEEPIRPVYAFGVYLEPRKNVWSGDRISEILAFESVPILKAVIETGRFPKSIQYEDGFRFWNTSAIRATHFFGCTEVVKLLIDTASKNWDNTSYSELIKIACATPDTTILEYTLSHNNDISDQSDVLDISISLARNNSNCLGTLKLLLTHEKTKSLPYNISAAFDVACYYSNLELLKIILEDTHKQIPYINDFLVKITDGGYNRDINIEILSYLLKDPRIDPTYEDNGVWNELPYLKTKNRLKAIKLLLDDGRAVPNYNVIDALSKEYNSKIVHRLLSHDKVLPDEELSDLFEDLVKRTLNNHGDKYIDGEDNKILSLMEREEFFLKRTKTLEAFIRSKKMIITIKLENVMNMLVMLEPNVIGDMLKTAIQETYPDHDFWMSKESYFTVLYRTFGFGEWEILRECLKRFLICNPHNFL